MIKFSGILVLMQFLFSILVFGNRTPHFHHYTTEDGLFHNEIRQIRQADNGMLWLGTQNGLSSFDGYRFKVYKHDKNDPYSLCSDKIYALEKSSVNGKIWVGTTVGLCVLDPLTGKSEIFPDTFNIKTGLGSTHIKSLYEDRAGYLWIAANTGNYRYSVHYNTMEKILPGMKVSNFYESNAGVFWISHDDQLSQYDRDNDLFIKNYPYAISKLFTDRFGILWGVGSGGLYRYMPGLVGFEHLPKVRSAFDTGFESIAEDKEGRLFLGVYGGGITVYDPGTGEIEHIIAHPGQVGSISSNDVYDVFDDQAGVVWVGTQEGLDMYDWSRQRFIRWKHDPEDSKGLSNSFIQCIFRDRNEQLWLGTRDNGLERLKTMNRDGIPVFDHFPPGLESGDLKGSYIGGILEDSKGRFWVASWGEGLNLRLPGEKRWINFRHDSTDVASIAGNQVISVLEDRRGRIWIATLSGLSRLHEDNEGSFFQNFKHKDDDSLSISNNAIFKLFEDSKGRIWLGTNNGGLNLMHEEPDGNIWFEHFMYRPGDPQSISNNEVFVIFEDSRQCLWVGTSAKGFNRVVEEKRRDGTSGYRFKPYLEEDGLSDNEVNGILEDNFGFLWISTNKGLSRFNPEDESFVNYSEYDGVLKGKFRKNAAWKDRDGTMYFGGAAGVNVFNSTYFPKNKIPPLPLITDVFIDGVAYSVGDSLKGYQVLSKDANGDFILHLSEQLNRFEVWFSAMSFTSPKRNRYRWKLHGYEKQWHFYEGSAPRAIYNALPNGKYLLEIEAANNDGVWSSQSAHMEVEVKTSFSMIYMASLAVLVVMVGLFFLRRRIHWAGKSLGIEVSAEEQSLISRLDQCMAEKQLYLDCKLGLNDLAEHLNISSNQLSALLNDQIGKSFYDYVNAYRIAEVKRRLIDPVEKDKTILSIAWECGFNSKSAFNRLFKQHTGYTPSAYQKKYA